MFVHSRFSTAGDPSHSLYSPLSIFASTCLISPLYLVGSRLSKKCESVKGICFDGRMRVKWYTSSGLIRIPEVMHLTWIKSSSRNFTSFTCSTVVSFKNILFFLNLKQNWMSWVKGIMERLHASTSSGTTNLQDVLYRSLGSVSSSSSTRLSIMTKYMARDALISSILSQRSKVC